MKRVFGFILLITIAFCAKAQDKTDIGAMVSAGFEQGFCRNWNVEVEEELRFDHDISQYARSKTTVGVNYKFPTNGLKIGAEFNYINKLTNKHLYRNRFRAVLNVSYKIAVRNWNFGFRTRLQTMMNDESRGYYNYRLENCWRNKLSVSYQQKNSRFKYGFSGELYCLLGNYNMLMAESATIIADVDIRLTRRQHLDIFVRDDRNIYIDSDKIRTIYFGIGWIFKN